MKRFRLFVAASLAVGLGIAACGDDDSIIVYVEPDSGPDSSVADASHDATPDAPFYANVGDADLDAGASTDAGIDADFDATPPYVTLFCQDYLTAQVGAITNCCPNDPMAPIVLSMVDFQGFTLPECTQFYIGSLATERVHYLPQMAKACIDAITVTAADCADAGGVATPKTNPVCELAFSGTQEQGEDCIGDQECSGGLPCQGSTCTAGATEAGAPCQFSNTRDGDPGLFAQRKRCIDGEICNGERCVPPGAIGTDCAFDSQCAAGLYCTDTFGGSCQPIEVADAGGTCVEDKFCNTGLSCQDGGCSPRQPAGTVCTDDPVSGTECAGYCQYADAGLNAEGLPNDPGPGTCHTFCGSN